MPPQLATAKQVAAMSVPASPLVEAIVRDELLDRLHTASLDEVLNETVEAILTSGENAPPAYCRQCRNLATIYSKEELKSLYASNFRRLLIYPPAAGEPGDFGGAEPISTTSVLVGIGIGVAGSLIAAVIYDWATDDEYTVSIDVDGVTIELTIDDDGHIVRQVVVNDGSR